MMLFAAVLVAFLSVNGVYTEHARIIGEPRRGEKIPIDITMEGGYMVAVSGQPNPPQPFFRQSINMYDFDKHLEARKVVDEGMCYIRIFKGTYAQMKQAVDAANQEKSKTISKVFETWNIPGEEIMADHLEETVGVKIAEFCSGYTVVWVKVNKKIKKMKEPRKVKRAVGFGGDVNYSPEQGLRLARLRMQYENGGLTAVGQAGYGQQRGYFANANLAYTRQLEQLGEILAYAQAGYDQRNGFGGNVGVGYANDDYGLSANAQAGYDQRNGFGGNIGVGYTNNGFSANARAEYNQRRGYSVSFSVSNGILSHEIRKTV